MNVFIAVLDEVWNLLLDSSPYILLGLAVAGLFKSFLSTDFISRHLGRGRFLPVLKAALLGIPIPLCSCGVMPAAASLKKQGASNGATIAFLISTPESGIDSISISYALLDPLLTLARPVAAFLSAMIAGLQESFFGAKEKPKPLIEVIHSPSKAAVVTTCPTGSDKNPGFWRGCKSGILYAFVELWGDLTGWFAFGLLLSGLITVMVPGQLITAYLGGGPLSLLIMLAVGIPIYICATASTPIAASLILKGVSPGAALVFLLAGPATNLASLAMLNGLIGRKSTIRYLVSLAVSSFLCGMLLDQVYLFSGVSARAMIGQAGELFPEEWRLAAALLLLALSIRPLYHALLGLLRRLNKGGNGRNRKPGCGCSSDTCGLRP